MGSWVLDSDFMIVLMGAIANWGMVILGHFDLCGCINGPGFMVYHPSSIDISLALADRVVAHDGLSLRYLWSAEI